MASLAEAPLSCYPGAEKVTYVSDVEGHWDFFCRFVELSPGINFCAKGDHRKARATKDLELQVEDGWHFVFGGDTCDKGPGSLRFLEALVRLKWRHPSNVHLLLGNRDINKMRWTSELAQSELDRIENVPGAYWLPENRCVTHLEYLRKLAAEQEEVAEEEVTLAMIQQRNTKANKLQYMLEHDMGSVGEFEFRRAELATIRGAAPEAVSDDEVVRSYEDSVREGGWMRAYLEVAQLGVLLGESLFVHGQIIGNCFNPAEVRAADDQGTAWCITFVPGEEERIWNAREWLTRLNGWGRRQVADWIAQPLWSLPPLKSTYDGWSGRGGSQLIAYGTPASKEPTVVYCRYLTCKAMPLQYPPELVDYLTEQGIRYVFVGHTPHGNAPTIIRSGAVTTVMGDTSYSHFNSNLAFRADNRGCAATAISLKKEALVVKGYTEKERIIDYAIHPDPEFSDPYIGRMQTPDSTGKQFFVKAKLPGCLGNEDDAYLMTSIQGYKYEYTTLDPSQVARSLQGLTLQFACGKKVVLRHAPFCCGELYGHSFAGQCAERLVDYLFERIDRDSDGIVDTSELLAACTDRDLRDVIRSCFPSLNVSEIVMKLDRDGDSHVSKEEFRTQLTRLPPCRAPVTRSALFFEFACDSGVGDTMGNNSAADVEPSLGDAFPKRLAPFSLQPTVALTAEDLLIDMVNLRTWASEERQCEIHRESFTTPELQSLLKFLPHVMAGEPLRGHLSRLQAMHFPASIKARAGIPDNAAFFSWCYPFSADWNSIFGKAEIDPLDPDVAFLSAGAFTLLDEQFQVISLMSVSLKVGGLSFVRPRRLSIEQTEQLLRQGLHPVTKREFLEGGASDFCWVGPTDSGDGGVKTPVETKLGGFGFFGPRLHSSDA